MLIVRVDHIVRAYRAVVLSALVAFVAAVGWVLVVDRPSSGSDCQSPRL
jgi:hypothetical protein